MHVRPSGSVSRENLTNTVTRYAVSTSGTSGRTRLGPPAAWPPRGRITKILECQRLAKHPLVEVRAISEHRLVNRIYS